jgi:hypothetical protein
MLQVFKEFVIPAVYLALILIIKKKWFDKKYDNKKSTLISDCLSCLVVPYFIVLSNWVMVTLFIIVYSGRIFPVKKSKSKNKK